MTNHRLNKSAGFTLVELIIYMGLFMMMLVVLTELFSSIITLRLDSSATTHVQQDTHYLLTRLKYDANRAQNIVTPAVAGASGAQLVLSIGGSNYTYQMSGNNLTLTSPAGTDVLNNSDTRVENLSFTRIGNSTNHDSIQITLTVTNTLQLTGSRTEQQTMSTTIGLRQP